MRTKLFAAFFGISLMLLSCGHQKIITPKDYLSWIDNKESGLMKEKFLHGLHLKVKYLPPEYLAYLDAKGGDLNEEEQKKSKEEYAKGLSFRLTIAPDERKNSQGDIMMRGVSKYEEYATRSIAMNFHMEEMVRLNIDGKQYKPVLSAMENVYGLDNKRSVVLVFAPGSKDDKILYEGKKIEFIYDDQLFELGKNYFVFNREKINNTPEFPLGEI